METQSASAIRQGAFRSPRNMFTDAKGSIHNDAVAGPLGFRGGTVPGSVHLDQFVPHLVDIYGERWFQRGGISMFFTQPTVDNEAVRVTVSPGADRATLRMENAEGATICEGTAACEGVDEGSELARRMAAQTPADRERLRILSEIKVGDEASGGEVSIALEALRDGLTVITEDLPRYSRDNVLPPSHLIKLAHQARGLALGKQKPAVALFGALEAQQLDGPLRAGVTYAAATKILKLTESPKTENVWYEVRLGDAGRDVARIVLCIRVLKGSSPLWAT